MMCSLIKLVTLTLLDSSQQKISAQQVSCWKLAHSMSSEEINDSPANKRRRLDEVFRGLMLHGTNALEQQEQGAAASTVVAALMRYLEC